MNGRAAEALIEAESILADPGLAPEVRNDAKIVLLQALTGQRDNEKAGRSRRSGRTTRSWSPHCSSSRWPHGTPDAGPRHWTWPPMRCAPRRAAPQAQRFYPDLFLAAKLINVHRFSEAQAVMNSLDRLDAPPAVSWTASSTHTLRARMALAAGGLDDTAAEGASRSAAQHRGNAAAQHDRADNPGHRQSAPG